jgi:hypothetical protein
MARSIQRIFLFAGLRRNRGVGSVVVPAQGPIEFFDAFPAVSTVYKSALSIQLEEISMFDNYGPAPVPPPVLIANMGIDLISNGSSLLARPKGPPIEGVLSAGTYFPRIPSRQIEQAAGLGRAYWRRHHRTAVFLFYVDLRKASWLIFVPPQMVNLRSSTRTDITKGYALPSALTT